MEQDKVIYSGYLLLPTQGKIVLKKSWQQKYCLLYKQSKFGIERLEIYDSCEEAHKHVPTRIITLENCVKITAVSSSLFIIITKTTQHHFGTISEQDLNEWVVAIQSVAFKDDISKVTSIEEDNDLYCSSGEGVFQVTLWPSEASKRCGLESSKLYTLVLTPTALQLRNSADNKILYTWPYCYIRRYGYRSGKFTFEAGRKCDSGEGVFHLEHSNQQQIFRCLSSKMKSMKKLLSGESTNSLLDCGDNQFHAALIMEARSRSPLPPSPTSSTRIHDIEMTESADKSLSDRRPLPKPRPTKPPRKHIPVSTKPQEVIPVDPEQLYEPMPNKNKYDQVEYRKEAWRTHGVSEVKHTESVDNEDDLEDYVSWGRGKQETPQEIAKTSSKIISTSKLSDQMYDKLQFFGSSSKLSTQSGYKQVSAAPIQPTTLHPSWGDYDEVEVNMQAVRLADDSHLGYGMIRKTTQPKVTQCQQITHQVFNDNVYAIVSKPKQV